MSWQCEQRIVANPTGATVSGASAAGGAHVYIDVAFGVAEWPWEEKGPVSLVPQPCEVTARLQRGEVRLGFAVPAPTAVLSPLSHSTTTSIRFTLPLTTPALVALEVARDGGTIEFSLTLVAHAAVLALAQDQNQSHAPGVETPATTTTFAFRIPKEQWLAVLKSVDFCDTLIIELRLPSTGPENTAKGRRRLVQGVAARNDGSYAEAMRGCRIALDELKNAGFGGKASSDVATFFQGRAGTMSQAERFSALQLALKLFLSPAHHATAPDEHYTREDAELAIAMTAALVRLAPVWTDDTKEDS
jgi:hypothetical protein